MYISSTKIQLQQVRNGLNDRGLSELSGISRQTISTIKTRGTCAPVTLGKVAAALGVDPAELLADAPGGTKRG